MSRGTISAGIPPPPPVETYILRPPDWRGSLSNVADLGFPDLNPARPGYGQDEDSLSEAHVKQGYVSKWGVPDHSESFSVHGLLAKDFGSTEGLSKMSETLSSILASREDAVPRIGPSTYKLPARFTMHESKRQTFISELADPSVPLHRLAKQIPHGFKGLELLEMLWTNNVNVDRGIWFVKVIGANEMQPRQGKPPPPPMHYSLEWTTANTSWLKKQLAEITLPSAPRPGFNVKQAFRSILSDEQTRDRWVAKWTYSLSLLRIFVAQSLVDHRTFLSWLVQQMPASNLAQLGFIVKLVEEYLEQILSSGALTRNLIEQAATRALEIENSLVRSKLDEVRLMIVRLLQTAFLHSPTLFASPRLYSLYCPLFDSIFSVSPEQTLPEGNGVREDALSLTVMTAMAKLWEEIRRRNESLLFKDGAGGGKSPRRQAMADINILDSICCTSDMSQVARSFFSSDYLPSAAHHPSTSTTAASASTFSTSGPHHPSLFSTKLDILLSWSIAYAQFGSHRAYAVATLLLYHPRPQELGPPNLQELVLTWMEESKVARKEENVEAVAEVIGELCRVGLVSFAGLLQRLMARGKLEYEEGEEPAVYRRLLRSIPLYTSTKSLLSQRRVALYGMGPAASAEEDRLAAMAKLELSSNIPELCTFKDVPTDPVTGLVTLLAAPKFVQIDVVRHWIADSRLRDSLRPLLHTPTTFAKLLRVLEKIGDFATLLDLLLACLETPGEVLLAPIIDAVRRHASIWTSMAVSRRLAESLFNKHKELRSIPSQNRPLLQILAEFVQNGALDDEDRALVLTDLESLSNALRPTAHHISPLPNNLEEVQMLCHATDPLAASALATTLWYRYQSHDDWPYVVWESVVLALAQLASAVSDPVEQAVAVDRYVIFLDGVHEHVPNGLDRHVRRWLRDKADQKLSSVLFLGGLDRPMISLLVQLALNGSLESVTLIDEIVLPIWRLSALQSLEGDAAAVCASPAFIATLAGANILAETFLLVDTTPPFCLLSFLPPPTPEQIHRIETLRVACFTAESFVKLVTHIPFLVCLDVVLPFESPLAGSCGALWRGLSKLPSLKLTSFRHSGTIKEAFLRPPWPRVEGPLTDSLNERLIDALKDIVSDGSRIDPTQSPSAYDWRKVITRLTPWRWSSSVLELQLSLKQLAIRLALPGTAFEAETLLNNLTRTVFERNLSPDETDLISEALKGMEAAPVEKFAIAGVHRLADLITSYDPTSPASVTRFEPIVGSVSNVLRVLACGLAQSSRKPMPPSVLPTSPVSDLQPTSEPPLHDRLMDAVLGLLRKVDPLLLAMYKPGAAEVADDRLGLGQLRCLMILALRALHITLGFSRMGVFNVWSAKAKAGLSELVELLVQLAVAHAGTEVYDLDVFDLVMDTLWYLIDELPKDTRAASLMTLRIIQSTQSPDKNPAIPQSLRKRLAQLFPFTPADPLVADLVLTSEPDSKVLPRPWEWLDPTSPPAPPVSHKETFMPPREIPNNTSVSLQLFRVEGTRDRVPAPSTSERFQVKEAGEEGEEPEPEVEAKREAWRRFGSEYADELEVGLARIRDWRTGRVAEPDVATDGESASTGGGGRAAAAVKAAAGAVDSSSVTLTAATPATAGGAGGTTTTATTAMTGTKRKASTNNTTSARQAAAVAKTGSGASRADPIVLDEDLALPVAKRGKHTKTASGGGGSGGATAAKTVANKSTTGGKTVASKTAASGAVGGAATKKRRKSGGG